MPTVPIRGVGEVGLVTDLNPQDAPMSAWQDARNVRFAEGVLSRYSIFKNARPNYPKTPVGVFNGSSTTDGYLVTVFSDGTVEQYSNGSATSVTPTTTTGPATDHITTTILGGVSYYNRQTDVPMYRVGVGQFQPIPGWSATDRCVSLRAYKDFLIALNVTLGSGQYGGMVKWSDAAQYGAPPANWDTASPSSLAGENVINDMSGPIVDGMPLADSFIIYGERSTVRMDYVGSPFIFRFQTIFDDYGVINKNAIIEHSNLHYVFGMTDFYVHDGLTRQSISDGFITDRVFSELDFSLKDRCFAYHDKVNGEIGFCYPTTDPTAQWSVADIAGCNRAAVFNYRFKTWTLVDLPSAVGATEVIMTQTSTWEDLGSWGTHPETWGSYSGTRPRNLLLTCSGNPSISKAGAAYFLDNAIKGRLSSSYDASVYWPAYALSLDKDVDDLIPDLYGRKIVSRIVPQFRLGNTDNSFSLTLGQSKAPVEDPTWGYTKTFTIDGTGKYDSRINGRYLSMRLDIAAESYVELSGYDMTIDKIAGR